MLEIGFKIENICFTSVGQSKFKVDVSTSN